jgi:hypothetical protein
MHSVVEEEQLRERPELASQEESVQEEQLKERPEFLRLVGQCSILVVICGIVAGLIVAA